LEEFAVVIRMVNVPKLKAKPIGSSVSVLPNGVFSILIHLVSCLDGVHIAMNDGSLIGRQDIIQFGVNRGIVFCIRIKNVAIVKGGVVVPIFLHDFADHGRDRVVVEQSTVQEHGKSVTTDVQ